MVDQIHFGPPTPTVENDPYYQEKKTLELQKQMENEIQDDYKKKFYEIQDQLQQCQTQLQQCKTQLNEAKSELSVYKEKSCKYEEENKILKSHLSEAESKIERNKNSDQIIAKLQEKVKNLKKELEASTVIEFPSFE